MKFFYVFCLKLRTNLTKTRFKSPQYQCKEWYCSMHEFMQCTNSLIKSPIVVVCVCEQSSHIVKNKVTKKLVHNFICSFGLYICDEIEYTRRKAHARWISSDTQRKRGLCMHACIHCTAQKEKEMSSWQIDMSFLCFNYRSCLSMHLTAM